MFIIVKTHTFSKGFLLDHTHFFDYSDTSSFFEMLKVECYYQAILSVPKNKMERVEHLLYLVIGVKA
jgi:hypothetical protein